MGSVESIGFGTFDRSCIKIRVYAGDAEQFFFSTRSLFKGLKLKEYEELKLNGPQHKITNYEKENQKISREDKRTSEEKLFHSYVVKN